MKRYILPLTLIIIGSFLFFYGGYQVRSYSNDPSTHFTGLCMTSEAASGGCPKEAAETNRKLSETPEAFVNRLWAIGVVAGFIVALSGLAVGIYRLVRGRHDGKRVVATKAKS